MVAEHDLLSTRSGHDLAPERHAGRAEARNLGIDVIDDEVDPVPSARTGLATVRHRTTRRPLGSAQQDAKWTANDFGECRSHVRTERESEVRRVEGDRHLDVVDHVAHVDRALGHHAKTTGLGSSLALAALQE